MFRLRTGHMGLVPLVRLRTVHRGFALRLVRVRTVHDGDFVL
jgi:hypothetical protein